MEYNVRKKIIALISAISLLVLIASSDPRKTYLIFRAEAPNHFLTLFLEDNPNQDMIVPILVTQQYIESEFDHNAVSSAGAIGTAQIIPQLLQVLLNLEEPPKQIPIEWACYAQVKHFNHVWKNHLQRMKKIGKRIGVKPRNHHMVNLFLVMYIGGERAFGGDETIRRILLEIRHTEPEKESEHHKPYAVNLYVTKILYNFGVLSIEKAQFPDELENKNAVIQKQKDIKIILEGLGYDLNKLNKLLMKEIP